MPTARIDEARRLINADLGTRGLPPDQLDAFYQRSFCPELRDHPALLGLVDECGPYVDALLGQGNLAPPDKAQIALRFPEPPGSEPEELPLHLDGPTVRDDRVVPGTFSRFSLLLGVLLSDLSEPGRGNLAVSPGSHHHTAERVGREGVVAMSGADPDVAPAVDVLGRPGDIVLVHPLVRHAARANVSPDVRCIVYFRLRHRNTTDDPEGLDDLWRDYSALG